MQYCSLQHRTLLLPPVTSTTWYCFCFASISSSFLELFPLFSSSILGTYRPGEFIFQCPIILPFHTVHGVLKARKWSGLPLPSPVDHILSELSTMTRPSWVALHGMAHNFIELDKAVVHVIRLVSFLWWGFSVCLSSDGEGQEAYGSFLRGETDWGGNWILFWWAGPCSGNLKSDFLFPTSPKTLSLRFDLTSAEKLSFWH